MLPFGGTTFPAANIIIVSATATAPSSATAGMVVGYGFTAPGQTAPSQTAFSTNQTVGTGCNATLTQFCASGTAGILCPGDAGSGFVVEVVSETTDTTVDTTEGTTLPTEATTKETPPPPPPSLFADTTIPTLVCVEYFKCLLYKEGYLQMYYELFL